MSVSWQSRKFTVHVTRCPMDTNVNYYSWKLTYLRPIHTVRFFLSVTAFLYIAWNGFYGCQWYCSHCKTAIWSKNVVALRKNCTVWMGLKGLLLPNRWNGKKTIVIIYKKYGLLFPDRLILISLDIKEAWLFTCSAGNRNLQFPAWILVILYLSISCEITKIAYFV